MMTEIEHRRAHELIQAWQNNNEEKFDCEGEPLEPFQPGISSHCIPLLDKLQKDGLTHHFDDRDGQIRCQIRKRDAIIPCAVGVDEKMYHALWKAAFQLY